MPLSRNGLQDSPITLPLRRALVYSLTTAAEDQPSSQCRPAKVPLCCLLALPASGSALGPMTAKEPRQCAFSHFSQ